MADTLLRSCCKQVSINSCKTACSCSQTLSLVTGMRPAQAAGKHLADAFPLALLKRRQKILKRGVIPIYPVVLQADAAKIALALQRQPLLLCVECDVQRGDLVLICLAL